MCTSNLSILDEPALLYEWLLTELGFWQPFYMRLISWSALEHAILGDYSRSLKGTGLSRSFGHPSLVNAPAGVI